MLAGADYTIDYIKAEVEMAVEEENRREEEERRSKGQDKTEEPRFCPGKPKPLTPAETQVCKNLTTEPPPAKFILSCRGIQFMRQGIVSLIVSMGGLGKTFLMLCLANALSSGNEWACFKPKQAYRTLFIGAEDDTDEMNRRLWTVGNGDFPVNLHAVSMAGKIGSLMQMDGENPVKSEWVGWLKETISAHMPLDVLFLDPLSRLYGLTENKNEHATFFIKAMESLSIEFGINILISHHANKDSSSQPKAKQGMSRGASGFIDGVRFAMALTEVSIDEAHNYGLENPEHFFKLDVVKSNGSAKLGSSLFFMKNPDTGIPEFFDLTSKNRRQAMSEAFYDSFVEHKQAEKRRDLLKGCYLRLMVNPPFTGK
jgi:AAA domain